MVYFTPVLYHTAPKKSRKNIKRKNIKRNAGKKGAFGLLTKVKPSSLCGERFGGYGSESLCETVTEFENGLFGEPVDFMTVYKDKTIKVTFKDGTEI